MSKVKSHRKKNNISYLGKEGNREKNLGFSPVMKGLSLPINAIIIIGLAILVLVVIAAFFGTNISIGSRNIEREQALDRACREYRDLYKCAGSMDNAKVPYSEPGSLCLPTAGGGTVPCSLEKLCGMQGLDVSNGPGGSASECAKRCGC